MQTQELPTAEEDFGSSGTSPSGTYEDREQELLKEIIDVKTSLDDFEHRVLRGQYQKINEQTQEKEWCKFSEEDIMNELGVREVMSRMVAKITKSARLTYKTEEEIYKDMFYFDMSISELFAKRAGNWDMDIEVAKSIKDACIDLVWDIVSSSRDGFTAINVRSTYSKSDVTRSDPTPTKSGGFFSSLLGRK